MMDDDDGKEDGILHGLDECLGRVFSLIPESTVLVSAT